MSGVVERNRAARVANEERQQRDVLARLKWTAPGGLSEPDMNRRLGWAVGAGAVLRRLAESGDAHEREGVWYLGPAATKGGGHASVTPPAHADEAEGGALGATGVAERTPTSSAPPAATVVEQDPDPSHSASTVGRARTSDGHIAPRGSTRERLRELVDAEPGIATMEAARRLGCRPENVRQHAERLGLVLRKVAEKRGPRGAMVGRLYPAGTDPETAPVRQAEVIGASTVNHAGASAAPPSEGDRQPADDPAPAATRRGRAPAVTREQLRALAEAEPGLSTGEIAERFGIGLTTAKAHLHAAELFSRPYVVPGTMGRPSLRWFATKPPRGWRPPAPAAEPEPAPSSPALEGAASDEPLAGTDGAPGDSAGEAFVGGEPSSAPPAASEWAPAAGAGDPGHGWPDFDPNWPAGLAAPEDAAVLALCERHGFGAVMDSAARQWAARDPVGALTVGPCLGLVRRDPALPSIVQAQQWLDGLHPNARAALSEHDRSALLALAGA